MLGVPTEGSSMMAFPHDKQWQRGTRPRLERPERIPFADGDVLVRNDIIAAELGSSERAMNRGDAAGAPFIYVSGVKYRPLNAYREFLAGKVIRRGQAPKRRGNKR
jgi:hypothetical protein